MAGKITGFKGRNDGINRSGDKTIPTAKWEKQHEATPENAGATLAGAMLKKAKAKSKGAPSLGIGR